MFGVPFDGPTEVFCDNQAVVLNTSKVESKLNKKHNQLAYNAVRWAVAAQVIRVGWIESENNLSDAMTKVLSWVSRQRLFGRWTY